MHRVGVIGDPVAHSLSPVFQQAAFDALGIDARFERWHTTTDELPDRISSLREPDALGAAVTVPHKLAVVDLVDDVSDTAREAGAVNTVIRQGNRLLGDNTDAHGFAASLLAVCPDAGNRIPVVLGAGGAARAVVLALRDLGCERVVLANRNPARAEALAQAIDAPLSVFGLSSAEFNSELENAGILINTTSLGWKTGETPIDLDLLALLPADALVVDLTYRDTDLLLAARAQNLATLDGLAMLVQQGARQFTLWTGKPAPLIVMMDAALAARASS